MELDCRYFLQDSLSLLAMLAEHGSVTKEEIELLIGNDRIFGSSYFFVVVWHYKNIHLIELQIEC